MTSPDRENDFFARLASHEGAETEERAPSRLKSRIYSALIRQQQQVGQLVSLTETKNAGQGLCVFEQLLQVAPVGEAAKCFNACSVCHARILAEHLEAAPIFWAHCPYVDFQKG